jgi:hypothetical protein
MPQSGVGMDMDNLWITYGYPHFSGIKVQDLIDIDIDIDIDPPFLPRASKIISVISQQTNCCQHCSAVRIVQISRYNPVH